ncbi:MAG: cysteine--tRNA ligase, partial [Calditrichaeota bacterium]
MALKLYNTLTKKKEVFEPLEPGKVKMYVCGPTVYDYIHIGNARAFIVFDVFRRFLLSQNYEVTYVMNLTDIDDKIIDRAQREGVDVQTITKKYTEAFFEDVDALGIKRADVHPRATDHIEDIVALIQKLVAQDLAYHVNGDVFFDVSKFERYGSLSGKKTDELIAGARVAVDKKKRSPLDFALWKSQKPGEPAWPSPWGPGRPGWHIECSAMSMKYLGPTFDIHAGGVDLIFPHHENEIAQSESATHRQFVRYWLHNGFLKIEGDKMAKSLGNILTVKEALKQFSAAALRLFFLQKHYRSPMDFTRAGLQGAESAVARLKHFYGRLNQVLQDAADGGELEREGLSAKEKALLTSLEAMRRGVVEAMEDDLNTPVALSHLFDLVREANKVLSQATLSQNEKRVLALVRKELDVFNEV